MRIAFVVTVEQVIFFFCSYLRRSRYCKIAEKIHKFTESDEKIIIMETHFNIVTVA